MRKAWRRNSPMLRTVLCITGTYQKSPLRLSALYSGTLIFPLLVANSYPMNRFYSSSLTAICIGTT